MPVRFRCSYCNQLLGISRRKIGLAVTCPTCQGQVIVPPRDTEGIPAPQPVIASARQFEQSEFERMLHPEAGAAPSERPRAPEPLPDFPIPAPENEPDVDVEPISLSSAAAGGLVVTTKNLTLAG